MNSLLGLVSYAKLPPRRTQLDLVC